MPDYEELMRHIRQQSSLRESEGFALPCLIWNGPTNGIGQGWFRFRGNNHNCTRTAWRWRFGPSDEGREIIAACGTAPCCEPTHLLLKTEEDGFIGGVL